MFFLTCFSEIIAFYNFSWCKKSQNVCYLDLCKKRWFCVHVNNLTCYYIIIFSPWMRTPYFNAWSLWFSLHADGQCGCTEILLYLYHQDSMIHTSLHTVMCNLCDLEHTWFIYHTMYVVYTYWSYMALWIFLKKKKNNVLSLIFHMLCFCPSRFTN